MIISCAQWMTAPLTRAIPQTQQPIDVLHSAQMPKYCQFLQSFVPGPTYTSSRS
jgi:hypothetical protein